MSLKNLKVDAVTAKLREFNGNIAAVARSFGVTRQAMHKYISSRPALQEIPSECVETMKDHAESILHKEILAGKAWAVCFFLKCRAKDRGYVEQQEQVIFDGSPLRVIEEIVDAKSQAERNGRPAHPASPGPA